MAGVFARTDSQRGVWKAPAGLEAGLAGVSALTVPMTDLENGQLNPLGVNCLRAMPGTGPVIWGSRTWRGVDRLADNDWKYIPVRRLALFMEESIFRGTQWAAFEPNDEPLWSQLRMNIGARLPTGEENVSAYYRKGIGLDGRVKAGQLTQLLNRPLGIRSASNPAASSGAADPEKMAEARAIAPLQTLTLDRVVSLSDDVDYSRAFPGVAKAHAVWVWTPRGRGVLVHVAGPAEAVFTAADALPGNLAAALLAHGDPLMPVIVRSGKITRFGLASSIFADRGGGESGVRRGARRCVLL